MENIILVLVEAILMPNGEVLSKGRSLGFIGKRQTSLMEGKAYKIAKGGEPIIHLSKGKEDFAA